jgi:uncharacterized small protein (DUF1192 family)
MTLQEAIKSGRNFRRKSSNNLHYWDNSDKNNLDHSFSKEEILADDWELEPIKELTLEERIANLEKEVQYLKESKIYIQNNPSWLNPPFTVTSGTTVEVPKRDTFRSPSKGSTGLDSNPIY